MKKVLLCCVSLVLLFALVGCQAGFLRPDASIPNPTAAIQLDYTDDNGVQKQVTLNFELFYDKAPISVLNFVKLANDKFYDGLILDSSSGLGNGYTTAMQYIGGGKYRQSEANSSQFVNVQEEKKINYTIKGEFEANGWTGAKDLVNQVGSLCMNRNAGTGQFDSASTEFYVSLNGATSRNGNYAIFGLLKSSSAKSRLPEQSDWTEFESVNGFYDWFLSDVLALTSVSRKTEDNKSISIPSVVMKIISVTVDTNGKTLPNPPTISK